MPDRPPPLADLAEMAERLDVHERTVQRLVAEGRIPHYRVGRGLRFDVAEVLESLKREAADVG